jgi:cysteinyl-tRNA synthetase
MAEDLLGVGFEIHGGGSDLIFPHHENEAAQTRTARGAELTRIWMHNGMLQLGGEKMAKSVGNIESLHDAIEKWGRDTIVLLFVSSHYRQPMQYSAETLGAARTGVRRLREAARLLQPGPSPEDMAPLRERFFAALADDFRTPEALAAVWDWVRESNRRGGVGSDDLREMLTVLALDNLLDADGTADGPDAAAQELLERREQARAARDWAEADRIRDELAAQGWQVRDSAGGPELVRADR